MKARAIGGVMTFGRWLAVMLLLTCPTATGAQWIGTAVPDTAGDVRTVRVKDGSLLQVRVLEPSGSPPFPLAIVSHGSPRSAADRPKMAVPRLQPISDWLLSRGYMVVLPLRRGYGQSGGSWAEAYGACEDPDFHRAGLQGGADILDVAAHFRATRTVRSDRLLLVGLSAGGWASLAAASTAPRGLLAVINLAGGRGGGQPTIGNCMPSRLVEASARFGATTRAPTLWLYSVNDKLFEPTLARRMVEDFVKAGGRAEFHALPAFGTNGHGLFADERGRALWAPAADAFLRALQ